MSGQLPLPGEWWWVEFDMRIESPLDGHVSEPYRMVVNILRGGAVAGGYFGLMATDPRLKWLCRVPEAEELRALIDWRPQCGDCGSLRMTELGS